MTAIPINVPSLGRRRTVVFAAAAALFMLAVGLGSSLSSSHPVKVVNPQPVTASFAATTLTEVTF